MSRRRGLASGRCARRTEEAWPQSRRVVRDQRVSPHGRGEGIEAVLAGAGAPPCGGDRVPPQEIWPSRYDRAGSPRRRAKTWCRPRSNLDGRLRQPRPARSAATGRPSPVRTHAAQPAAALSSPCWH